MPYVPPEEKERIKREVSIQRLAEARGIKLVRSGKELIGLCPFHDDRNPSLNIDPAKNVWHCKGACGEGGDVILWVMRAEGVSFHHALELLRKDYVPSAGPVVKIATVPKLPPLIDATADDKKLLGTVVDYYHRTLKLSPEAQRYLVKRGLESGEIVDRFKLGYANRTLCLHLPASNRGGWRTLVFRNLHGAITLGVPHPSFFSSEGWAGRNFPFGRYRISGHGEARPLSALRLFSLRDLQLLSP